MVFLGSLGSLTHLQIKVLAEVLISPQGFTRERSVSRLTCLLPEFSSLPGGPLQMAAHHVAAWFIGVSKKGCPSKQMSQTYATITEVVFHNFYHMSFVRNMWQVPSTLKGRVLHRTQVSGGRDNWGFSLSLFTTSRPWCIYDMSTWFTQMKKLS